MAKIIYIVSTLKRSGPTSQLYNLIKYLDRSQYTPYLITLSPEPVDSCWSDFEEIGVKLYTLNLSRLSGLFMAKSALRKIIKQLKPDLIHTQGIRADSLLSSLKLNIPWVMTSRNFPADDYPTKFGALKGSIMVRQHLSAMKRCRNLVACSKTIQKKLKKEGINGMAIQNGVRALCGDASAVVLYNSLPRPIFISIGSLIPRKNMQFLINAFDQVPTNVRGSLVVLGDGLLMDSLSSNNSKDVHFVGNVKNVPDYLAGADYFVSTSLSEGLPNTVLEALSAGLPVVLSNIDSHQEIALECKRACKIFKLDEGETALANVITNVIKSFDETSSKEAKQIAQNVFSAEGMSSRYQAFYTNILEAT